jgi:NADPH:quinone reductase-like Zn-dependent oxidoreductase
MGKANLMEMRALILEAYGQPLRLISVPRPTPGEGQVLVRIMASGTNPLDVKIQKGAAPHARHPPPSILGLDLAGVVEEVGAHVTTFKPRDEVYGMTGGVGGLQGSLAEFAAVDARLLALKPRNLTMREAAAMPLAFITAWEGLVDQVRVCAGQKVLVQGTGGVGHMAIQIARAFGADVFATCSSEHKSIPERFGATAIDYHAVSVKQYVDERTGGAGFDIIYDTVGGPVLDASFKAVRRSGRVVSCLGWGTHSLAPLSFRAASYSGVFTLLPLLTGSGRQHHGAILKEATCLVEATKVVPLVDPERFTLDSVADAYAAIERGSRAGKRVIDI